MTTDRTVLDRLETPDGPIELVAYRELGDLWVGLAWAGGELITAIGPRTGSVAPRVSGIAKTFGAWGLGCGVIGPGIVRAEMKNDSGEVFPAKIVPLPTDLDPQYRAVWGKVERCQGACDLVGYDERGLAYDESDPLPSGSPPSDMERLDAIRRQIHDALRYYATAYLNENGENQSRIHAYLTMSANVMCLFEADSLDNRSVLARRDKIVNRYLEDAKTNPWRPQSGLTE